MQILTQNKFKHYLNKLFQIKLMVNSSENIKNLLSKFNLTPAEFLRPFGVMSENKKIKIKSINSKDKMIPEFILDFYDLEEFQSPKQKIDEIFREVLVNNSPDIVETNKYVKICIFSKKQVFLNH